MHDKTPIEFVEGDLGLPLYDWQAAALSPLAEAGYGQPIVQVSALAPNEGGKSSRIVAGSACYWVGVHSRGKVVITTKDGKQLNEQIIPAIEAQLGKFEGWRSVKSPYYRVTTPSGGIIVAYTTDDAARVEGFHGSEDSPLLVIIDEAKSVPEPIFSGLDRCGYQALVYCSSGGPMMGTFYDSHTKHAASFVTVKAGLADCPHIAAEKIERIESKYGKQNPFTISCLYGGFMAQSDTDEYCIELVALLNCINSPPKHRPGVKCAFIDFGAGVAEHVIAYRDGNKITIAAAWVEANKDATAGRIIRELRKLDLKPDQVWCDASDKEIWVKLSNAGWPIHRQNFGAPAKLPAEYTSWGAEAWIEGGIKIASHEIIVDDDDVLKSQLVTRKKRITAAGKLGTEDKIAMAERGLPSPDRGDAVLGAAHLKERIEVKQPFNAADWRDEGTSGEHSECLHSIGANAGL